MPDEGGSGGRQRPPSLDDARRRRADARARSNGHVPPHNLPAEESLLGAALLTRDAAEIVAVELDPAAFYKPSHGHIADAIRRLFVAGAPIDPVTVNDELHRADLDDICGGLPALLSLEAHTPATGNAGRYAKIIADHATMRALAATSAEIADLAYGLPSDVGAMVIRAQELLERASNGSGITNYSTLDVADVGAILDGTFELVDPDFLTRTDGQALLYAGKMHVLQAEPTSGKSWLALAASIEILELGGAVIYLDYEDTPRGIVGRLLQLGADPGPVRERFRYVRQDGGFGPAEKAELERLAVALNPDLIVIDGVAEALARDGYDEDKARDVVEWVEKFPRWLSRKGSAVLMLDHVTKDKEKRGRTARGSGHKLAAVDGAAYEVIVTSPFSRHKDGKLLLKLAKDRLGSVGATGEIAAEVSVSVAGAGERVLLKIEPHVPKSSKADAWKPTRIMARISRELEHTKVPLTADMVVSLVRGRSTPPTLVREGITRLISEGYLTEAATKPKTLRLLKPYIEDAEADPNAAEQAQQDLELGIDPDRPPGDPGF